MKNNINDPTWLTQTAAIKLLRYAVATLSRKAWWHLLTAAKIDRIFARQASSRAFARALSDRLAPLIEVDVDSIRSAQALSDFACALVAQTESRPSFIVRLYGAMSLAFDFAVRGRRSARLDWLLDPWCEWEVFLPNPTDPGDEDYVLICALVSGVYFQDLGYEMLNESPVLVIDTMCRMASLLWAEAGDLREVYKSTGVDGLVRAFDDRRSAVDLEPRGVNMARAAIVYLISGECCWGKAWRPERER